MFTKPVLFSPSLQPVQCPCSSSGSGFQEQGRGFGCFALQLFRSKHTLQNPLKQIKIVEISCCTSRWISEQETIYCIYHWISRARVLDCSIYPILVGIGFPSKIPHIHVCPTQNCIMQFKNSFTTTYIPCPNLNILLSLSLECCKPGSYTWQFSFKIIVPNYFLKSEKSLGKKHFLSEELCKKVENYNSIQTFKNTLLKICKTLHLEASIHILCFLYHFVMTVKRSQFGNCDILKNSIIVFYFSPYFS